MFKFVIVTIAFICIVLGVLSKIFQDRLEGKISKKTTMLLPIIGVLLILASSIFTVVPTGYTGVKTTFGQVSDTSLSEGINFKLPLVQTIDLVNNKQQDVIVGQNQIWGESSEKTPVFAAAITVSYKVLPEKSAWLYINISKNDKDLITEDVVSSSIKSSMVQFANKEVTVRNKIEPLVKENLQKALNEKYGEGVIRVVQVVIKDMDFEDSFNQAIAAKSIAQQTQEKQEIENKTAIEKAEADKKVAIANAEARAESKRIAAEAEAKANELINKSLNEKILESKFYEKWNGELPAVMGDSASIVDIGNISENK
jgi:regulator of protease activity HflC (stomatin/prohibitin superfamily)